MRAPSNGRPVVRPEKAGWCLPDRISLLHFYPNSLMDRVESSKESGNVIGQPFMRRRDQRRRCSQSAFGLIIAAGFRLRPSGRFRGRYFLDAIGVVI